MCLNTLLMHQARRNTTVALIRTCAYYYTIIWNRRTRKTDWRTDGDDARVSRPLRVAARRGDSRRSIACGWQTRRTAIERCRRSRPYSSSMRQARWIRSPRQSSSIFSVDDYQCESNVSVSHRWALRMNHDARLPAIKYSDILFRNSGKVVKTSQMDSGWQDIAYSS